MTGPPPKELLHPFQAPAPHLGTEADAEDTSNGLNTTRAYSCSGGEEDGDFLPVEELLLNIGDAQEWQRTGSTNEHVTGGSKGKFEHTAEGDRNSAASPRSSEGEHKEKSVLVGDGLTEDRDTQDAQREAGGSISAYTSDYLTADRGDDEREAVRLDKSIVAYDVDSDDSDAFIALRNKPKPIFKHPKDRNNRASSTPKESGCPGDPIVVVDEDTDSSGDGTSEEQVGNQGSLMTSPTSVGSSRSRSLNLHEKSERDNPNTSLPYHNTLSSTLRKRICGSKYRDREGLMLDPSSGRNKNLWNSQEAEAEADNNKGY